MARSALMARRAWAMLMLAVTLLAFAPPAAAQTRARSAFWREVRSPGYARSRELLRQGRALAALAARVRGPEQRARLLASTRRYRHAHELAPGDPEALFELARALATEPRAPGEPVSSTPATEEARTLFRTLREQRPAYEAQRVAFELGVLAARAQNFPEAALEYQRSLDAVEVGEGAPSMHANLAEVLMLSAQLAEAEQEYRRAVALGDGRPSRGLALSLFGLAVCLDRRDDPQQALAVMRRALGITSAAVLRADGVFFEPAAEIHFYEALALRTQAADAERVEDKTRLRRQASAALRRYLDGTAHESAFYELAARRLEALRAAMARPRRPRTSASGRGRPRR